MIGWDRVLTTPHIIFPQILYVSFSIFDKLGFSTIDSKDCQTNSQESFIVFHIFANNPHL